MNKILETTENIINNSKYVNINKAKIAEYIEKFEKVENFELFKGKYSIDHLSDEEKLNYLVIFNALNFCYWGDPKWKIEYSGETYDGAYAMILALLRAKENDMNIINLEYCEELSDHHLMKIFQGTALIPLLIPRSEIVKNLSRTIINNFSGDFRNFLKKVNSVEEFLKLLGKNFFAFQDISIIGADLKKVYFYKKAQLLLYDLKKFFPELIEFEVEDELTACADYKIPQSLRQLGILEYNEELSEMVDTKVLIKHNSLLEIEIRSATIWAVEFIKRGLKNKGINVTAIDIDSQLWVSTQEKKKGDKPYHLCETIFY